MDDYRDVDEDYARALEKTILDAGLALPSTWPPRMTKEERRAHARRVEAARKAQEEAE